MQRLGKNQCCAGMQVRQQPGSSAPPCRAAGPPRTACTGRLAGTSAVPPPGSPPGPLPAAAHARSRRSTALAGTARMGSSPGKRAQLGGQPHMHSLFSPLQDISRATDQSTLEAEALKSNHAPDCSSPTHATAGGRDSRGALALCRCCQCRTSPCKQYDLWACHQSSRQHSDWRLGCSSQRTARRSAGSRTSDAAADHIARAQRSL